ncbi:uncharacterized protein LOC116940167 isoform X2 [Petromyzon marinus]|uniref:uncharacterized protein LOC116940167 isoform X2 n=1 Tax=Petromyzon marinus TaxID=7757 RepID=UPI003F71FB6B
MEGQVKDHKKSTLASRLPRLTRRSPARPSASSGSSPLCVDSGPSSTSGKTSSNGSSGSGNIAGSAGTGDSAGKRFSLFRRPSFALRSSRKKTPSSPTAAASVATPTMVPMRPMGGDAANRDSMGSGEREFSFCESPRDGSNSATLESKSSRCSSSVDSRDDAASGSRFSRGFRFPTGGERSGKKVKRSLSDSFARESLLTSATRGVFRSCIRPNRNSGEFDKAVMTGYRNAAVALPLLELAEETDPRELQERVAAPALAAPVEGEEEEERSPGVDSLEAAAERPLRFVKTASADNVCEVWSLTGSRESSVFQNIIVKTQSTSSHVWERNQADADGDAAPRAGDGKSPRRLHRADGPNAANQSAMKNANAHAGADRADDDDARGCIAKPAAAPTDGHHGRNRAAPGASVPHVGTASPESPRRAQARADPSRRGLPLVAETRSAEREAAAPGGDGRAVGGSRFFYQGGSAHRPATNPRGVGAGAGPTAADAPAPSGDVAGAREVDPRRTESGPESLAWSVAHELHIEEVAVAAACWDEAPGAVEGPGADPGGDAGFPHRVLPLKAGGRAQAGECLRRLSEGSEGDGALNDDNDDGGGVAVTAAAMPVPASRHRQHDEDRRDRGESFASSGVNSMDMLHSLGSLELDEDDLMLDSEHLELSLNGLSLLTGGIEPLQSPGDIRQLNLQRWTENAQRGRTRTRSECSQPERAEQPDPAGPPHQRTSSAHASHLTSLLPSPSPATPEDGGGNGAPPPSSPSVRHHGCSLPPLGGSPPSRVASRHPRSPLELPWSSEEGLCSPEQRGTTYRHIMAECTALKTMLFRLRRVLHEDSDVSLTPATPPPAFPGGKEEADCIDQVLLLEEMERLRDKVRDQEMMIERLQVELEERGRDGRSASVAAGSSFESRPPRAERGTQTTEPTQPANTCRRPTTDTVASVAATLAATRPSAGPSEAARPDLQFADRFQASHDESSGRVGDLLVKTELVATAELSRSLQQQQQHASDGLYRCGPCSVLIDRDGKTARAKDSGECRSCASPRERFFEPQSRCGPCAASASAAPGESEAAPARPPGESSRPVGSCDPARGGPVEGFRAGIAPVVSRTAGAKNGVDDAPVDLRRHAAWVSVGDGRGERADFAAGAAGSGRLDSPAPGLCASTGNGEPVDGSEDRFPGPRRDEPTSGWQSQTGRPCDQMRGLGHLTSIPMAGGGRGGGDLRCFSSPLPGHLAEWVCSEGEIADNGSGIAVSGEGNCCQLIAQDKPGFVVSV